MHPQVSLASMEIATGRVLVPILATFLLEVAGSTSVQCTWYLSCSHCQFKGLPWHRLPQFRTCMTSLCPLSNRILHAAASFPQISACHWVSRWNQFTDIDTVFDWLLQSTRAHEQELKSGNAFLCLAMLATQQTVTSLQT